MNQATQRNNERDTECLLLQNVRFEKRMEHLQDLQRELFLEQQNRKKEEFVSPAVRLGNFWYFSRNFVGKPYDVQYRLPVIADDDWNPPDVIAVANQSDVKGEEVVFDANAEIGSSKYFHLQDLSISNDGKLLLYSTDTKGNERYTVHLRRITQSKPLSDVIPDTGGACLSPDGQWVFYLVLDNQMRPFAVKRHHIGSSIQEDVEVFREKVNIMRDGVVVAEQLSKNFVSGDGTPTVVFNDLSFVAAGGAMTAITGPSGCGKSTLLYCLSGLEQPSQGNVWVLGEELTKKNQRNLALFRRSHIGFVFQSYNLVPSMTVRDNILLPLTLSHRKVDQGSIDALMDKFHLSGHDNDAASSLSGGEQQRVSLIRTLVADPDVVFADEPTGALDQKSGQLVFSQLRDFSHRPGKCVVVVTHDLRLARQCDVVYTMSDGGFVASGNVEEQA